MKTILTIGLLLLNVNAFAANTDYQAPELLARTNLFDTYNLPELSFLSNNNPEINNRGDVTFKVLSSNGPTVQGVWVKRFDDENGKMYFHATPDMIVSDPSLNQKGEIAFSVGDIGYTEGIYIYDANTDLLDHRIKGSTEVDFFTYPNITSSGEIFFRTTNKVNERAFYSFDAKGSLSVIASEESDTPSNNDIKTSYLFKLSVNDSGSIAFKRRLGAKGEWNERNKDEIVLMKKNAQGTLETIVVAQDVDADPKSKFISFMNTVSISDNDIVVFAAELKDRQNGIFLYKEGEIFEIAKDKNESILEIERFEARVNSHGQVAFRARDVKGDRAIYIADTKTITKLITVGDEIPSDKGPARILSNINYPGFSGNIDLNDNGDIVFNCILVSPEHGTDWGTAIYKLSPIKK